MPLLTIPLLLSLTGCKVVDAPTELEDLVVFGFEHFHDDEQYLVEVADALPGMLAAHAEDLDKGVRVSELTEAHLVAAGVDNPEITGVIGALGAVTYHHPLEDVLSVLTRDDKDLLFENMLAYDVLSESDRSCFLAGDCLDLTQTVDETASVTLLGEATRTYTMDYRRITPTEGPEVVFIRTLSPDPVEFSSNIVKVHQQYALVALLPGGGTTQRVETFWVDAEVIGMDVPDSFAVDNAVSSMADQAERVDAVLDDG